MLAGRRGGGREGGPRKRGAIRNRALTRIITLSVVNKEKHEPPGSQSGRGILRRDEICQISHYRNTAGTTGERESRSRRASSEWSERREKRERNIRSSCRRISQLISGPASLANVNWCLFFLLPIGPRHGGAGVSLHLKLCGELDMLIECHIERE